MKKNEAELHPARAESYLRIQRADIFRTVYNNENYINSGPGESSLFRKRVNMPRSKKKTAETKGKLVAIHLEDKNKGYPDGFTNYQTYDPKRNENYDSNNEKFRASRYNTSNI